MIRYYCSGFDTSNAFGHGLGQMFKKELKNMNSIVYIPGGPSKIEKAKEKYIPIFRNHFSSEGISFDKEYLINPDMNPIEAQRLVKNASFVMLMGGDPFQQKEMCQKLGILEILKKYEGIMLGFSAGAMLMSKYIIITPCSIEYPDFHIEEGLNLDEVSIYPHNNTEDNEYPDVLVIGDEAFKKEDLIKVASQYGEYYLLQDNLNNNGKTDISIIKSNNGLLEEYIEENGKIWIVSNNGIKLKNNSLKHR